MGMQLRVKDEWISIGEYLDGELLCDIKHEYIDGYVYALSGVSRNHERIALNIAAEFRARHDSAVNPVNLLPPI